MTALLREFCQKEADRILLFLTNLSELSVWEWKPNAREPTVVYQATASGVSEGGLSLAARRLAFLTQASGFIFFKGLKCSMKVLDFTLTVETEGNWAASGRRASSTWRVCNSIAVSGTAAQLATAEDKLLPLVGLAGLVSGSPPPGRAFCCLPLPIDTGLSVEVKTEHI